MEITLKNGQTMTLRPVVPEDAEGIVEVIAKADRETRFLAREPGEFSVTLPRERELIEEIMESTSTDWFVAVVDGRIVGQCAVGLIRHNLRFRHRAEVAFVVLKDYWGLGIASAMMQKCLDWCPPHGVTQVELDVVRGNERAMALYERFGFRVVGETPNAMRYANGETASEYRMICELGGK